MRTTCIKWPIKAKQRGERDEGGKKEGREVMFILNWFYLLYTLIFFNYRTKFCSLQLFKVEFIHLHTSKQFETINLSKTQPRLCTFSTQKSTIAFAKVQIPSTTHFHIYLFEGYPEKHLFRTNHPRKFTQVPCFNFKYQNK